MFGRRRRVTGMAAMAAAVALLAASPASATTIGSNLQAAPNGGICATEVAGEVSCTYMQLILPEGHGASGNTVGIERGDRAVITSWRVSSGPATAATASVKLRLRILRFTSTLSAGAGTSLVDLPLADPGIHSFPARLPIDSSKHLALDAYVTGSGNGEAAAPIAHIEGEEAAAGKWSPSLIAGEPDPRPVGTEDAELLFNAVVERDRDRDGYGDRTQDRCPEDPSRHARCDRRPPRTHLTYAERQDFLRTQRVVVRLRSNEAARVFAYGQIDIDADKNVVWGIYSDRKNVGKGDKRKLVLRVPAKAREAAARSFAHGRHVVAKVSVFATDVAGNESGTTVATIRPKR